MNRRPMLVVSLLVVGMLIASAVPAMATGPQPTGQRILLLAGDQSYPANTPFHILGGFSVGRGTSAWGRYQYQLEMDGVTLSPSFRTFESSDVYGLITTWTFNFPDGLSGIHTFTGHYLVPCDNDSPVVCGGSRPNTLTEIITYEADVTFTP